MDLLRLQERLKGIKRPVEMVWVLFVSCLFRFSFFSIIFSLGLLRYQLLE
jgi:hypothetical protein